MSGYPDILQLPGRSVLMPASQGQTRRKVGTQNLRSRRLYEIAGLPAEPREVVFTVMPIHGNAFRPNRFRVTSRLVIDRRRGGFMKRVDCDFAGWSCTGLLGTLTLAALAGSGTAAASAHHHSYSKVTISGTPATTDTVGTPYNFTPAATDSSGRTLTFFISNKPAWAAFNSASGQLSGTPSSSSVGTFSNIVISARDSTGASASLPAFSIAVSAPASTSSTPPPAPTISGTPAPSVTAGSAYAFTPATTDPSGGTLTFSIANKPSWATFSTSSGALSGSPTSANVGTYNSILISVSDGVSSASLPSFGISVVASTSGSATVKWTAPTLNTDGSALTNLAGYYVKYGTSPTSLTGSVQIASAGATSYTVTNLTSGTWYFAVASYTTGGTQSAPSQISSATVQ